VGEPAARVITISAIVLSYLLTIYLVFVARFLTPIMLIVLLAYKPARVAIQRMSSARPSEPPAGYPIWPRWFSTVCFVHNRVFSNYFVLGLVIDTALRFLFPSFWH